MDFEELLEKLGRGLEGVGVAIIVLGVVAALVIFARQAIGQVDRLEAYEVVRRRIGRSILLGLEVLVGADIIRTVATDPTFTSVGVLAFIVAVRTFLSFSLEVELNGRWPWQRAVPGPPPGPAR